MSGQGLPEILMGALTIRGHVNYRTLKRVTLTKRKLVGKKRH